MKSILSSYFKRLIKTPLFYIITILCVVFIFIYISSLGSIANNYYLSSINPDSMYYGKTLTLSRYTLFLTLINPFMFGGIFVFIFLLKFFSEEWINDTFRNQILSGKTRSLTYFTGLIFSVLIYFGYILISFFLTYTYGFAYHLVAFDPNYSIGEIFASIFMSLIIILAVISLLNFISHSIHGLGGTIVILFGYIIVEYILLFAFGKGYNTDFFGNYFIYHGVCEFFQIYQYSLLTNSNMPVVNFFNIITQCINTIDTAVEAKIVSGNQELYLSNSNEINTILKTIIVNLGLLSLFNYLGVLIFNKRDLR